jgi:hypothetical protein
MSYFEFREYFERMIPFWVPFAIAAPFVVYLICEGVYRNWIKRK